MSWMCGVSCPEIKQKNCYCLDKSYEYDKKKFICIRKIGHRGIHVYGAVCSNLVDACDSIRIFSYSTYFGNIPKEVIDKGKKSFLYKIDEHTDICYYYGKQSKSHKCTFDIDKEMEEYEKKEGVLDAN